MQRLKRHLKTFFTVAIIASLGLSFTECNRKYANAGDKKKAYKRKYKCKMCYTTTDIYYITRPLVEQNTTQLPANTLEQ